MINRRQLLGAATAAVAGAKGASTLALHGGKPVREKPLKAGYWGSEFYDEKERAELLDVLDARSPFRWYGPGPTPKKVLRFEKEFAARMGVKYALAVTSGTTALQCAMAALEIGPGDEVILPSWTWHSCFNAVVLAGALPVCAEIDESFNLDADDLVPSVVGGVSRIQDLVTDLLAVSRYVHEHHDESAPPADGAGSLAAFAGGMGQDAAALLAALQTAAGEPAAT